MMVRRERYLKQIEPFIDNELVKVLVGVRRSGKTVLLSQIQDCLGERGIKPEQIISLNFESMKNRQYQNADALYQYVSQIAERIDGKVYIFMDEIQEVEGWQTVVNSFRVDLDCDIYITGSNSKLLSGELATVLSGRYVQIKVLPFTFAEVCQLEQEQNRFSSYEASFANYLKYGGFPGRCLLPDEHSVMTYLLDLYDAVMIRDIVNRHQGKGDGCLKKCVGIYVGQCGKSVFSEKNCGEIGF